MLTLAPSRASTLFGQGVAAFQFLKFRLYSHDWIIERLARQNMHEREGAGRNRELIRIKSGNLPQATTLVRSRGRQRGRCLHYVATKQAIFFSIGTKPAGHSTPKQDEDTGTTHNQRQCRFDKLPSFAKRCQTRRSHSATPHVEVDTFVSIDSIIRTRVDFGLKKMNLKLIFCKTLRSLCEPKETVALKWRMSAQ